MTLLATSMDFNVEVLNVMIGIMWYQGMERLFGMAKEWNSTKERESKGQQEISLN